MKQRLIDIGNAILEFLKDEEGCEQCVFETKYMDSSIGAYIDFRWRDHHFQVRFEQTSGGVVIGEVAKHKQYKDRESKEDMADIPFLGIDGHGPIGRIPSQCRLDVLYITEGGEENGRYKYEHVLWFENPSEVHLLPPECVKRLDEIIVRDFTRFFKRHFMVWEHGGVNLKILTDPRHC